MILASTENPNDLTVDIGMQCACAGASALCTAQCTSGAAPAVFVEISALQPYDGIIFPERTLTSLTRVQIR